MTDRIGSPGLSARQSIESALRRQQAAMQRLSAGPAEGEATAGAKPDGFGTELNKSVSEVMDTVRRVDELPKAILDGRVDSFHEASAALKQAELSMKFALQVRNKFVDAYREVMRMSV